MLAMVMVAMTMPASAATTVRYYKCDSGFLNPDRTPAGGNFGVTLGSTVYIDVKNASLTSVLQITVADTASGQSKSYNIGFGGTHTFTFDKGPGDPQGYNFVFTTTSGLATPGSFVMRSYFCNGVQIGPVKSGISGKCMDDYGSGTADGTKVDIWDCNGKDAQSWGWGYRSDPQNTWDNEIRNFNKCLDVVGGGDGAVGGDKVQLWTCNGTGAQRWSARSDGSLVNTLSGLCLSDPGASKVNGTQLEVRACSGKTQQMWTLPVTTAFLSG